MAMMAQRILMFLIQVRCNVGMGALENTTLKRSMQLVMLSTNKHTMTGIMMASAERYDTAIKNTIVKLDRIPKKFAARSNRSDIKKKNHCQGV
ncbi:uncharacterized protein ARMOST_16723 [Armillaria ostoyae]|uniref:Secreted protein n=1 Tax=Armillaria ostoyae TaxID=47428 RepID=A0A284RX00_ARMOS|nr:uncharacterized protein ARMOST_16723 [Armillaria ostoyae]